MSLPTYWWILTPWAGNSSISERLFTQNFWLLALISNKGILSFPWYHLDSGLWGHDSHYSAETWYTDFACYHAVNGDTTTEWGYDDVPLTPSLSPHCSSYCKISILLVVRRLIMIMTAKSPFPLLPLWCKINGCEISLVDDGQQVGSIVWTFSPHFSNLLALSIGPDVLATSSSYPAESSSRFFFLNLHVDLISTKNNIDLFVPSL